MEIRPGFNPSAQAGVLPREGENFLLRPTRKIRPEAIDKVISGEPFSVTGNPHPFMDVYRAYDADYEQKYAFACALIKTGKCNNKFLKDLSTNFIVRSNEKDQDGEAGPDSIHQKLARELDNNLKLLLLKMGVLDPENEEAKGAEEALFSAYERDEYLKYIHEILPQEEAYNVEFILHFGDVPDNQLFETLRSWSISWRIKHDLLRRHLGRLETQKPPAVVDLPSYWRAQPNEVFVDRRTTAYMYAREMVKKHLGQEFANGKIQEGFAAIQSLIEQETSERKKSFLQSVNQEFEAIVNQDIPPEFVETLPGWLSKEPLPLGLFHHLHFLYKFKQTRRMPDFGDPGTGKTARLYLGMRALDRKRVTIFAPAQARETWVEQADKLFKPEHRPDVFIVREGKDIYNPRFLSADFVCIGLEFVSQLWDEKKKKGEREITFESLQEQLKKRKSDGAGVDEAHNLRNPKTNTFKAVAKLIINMEDAYEQETGEIFPLDLATGTPISKDLADLDPLLGLLYRNRVALPYHRRRRKTPTKEDWKKITSELNLMTERVVSERQPNADNATSTTAKYTFSELCGERAGLAHLLLYGEGIMFRVTLKDVYGENASRLEYERIQLPLTALQRILYRWAWKEPTSTFTKLKQLHEILLHPDLFMAKERMRGKYQPAHTKEELLDLFHQYHLEWMEETLQGETNSFGTDWIASRHPDTCLDIALSKELKRGFYTLLAESDKQIRQDWQEPESSSPKVAYIKAAIADSINRDGGILKARRKVIPISPHYTEGITTDTTEIDSREIKYDVFTLVDDLKLSFPDFPPHWIVGIDGAMPMSRRKELAQQHSNNPEEMVFPVISARSMNISISLALGDLGMDEPLCIHLSPYHTDKEFWQMYSRWDRPGSQIRPHTIILEGESTHEQGKYNLMYARRLFNEIIFSGIRPTGPAQELFTNQELLAEKVLFDDRRLAQMFLNDIFREIQGKGEKEFQEVLSRFIEDIPVSQLLAEYYFDEGNDEYRRVGQNAGFVANVISSCQPERILSVACGTGLFALKLRQLGYEGIIDNVDINQDVLALAKYKRPNIGNTIVSSATELLVPDEVYDAVESSFLIDQLRLYDVPRKKVISRPAENIERVRYHLKQNRVMKPGAIAVDSFSENAFDEETFQRYCTEQAGYGFEIIPEASGMTWAYIDGRKKRIGWIVTKKKVAPADTSIINPSALELLTDEQTIISEYKSERSYNDNSPHPTVIDYSLPTDFEVENPLTGSVNNPDTLSSIIAPLPAKNIHVSPDGANTGGEVVVFGDQSQPDELTRFKESLPSDVYHGKFRHLVRSTAKAYSFTFGKAEEIVYRAIMAVNMKLMNERENEDAQNGVKYKQEMKKLERKIRELALSEENDMLPDAADSNGGSGTII